MQFPHHCFIVLGFLFILPAAAETKKAPRPAWTSTLQCLAPLAREARRGTEPLRFEQAFFDGPFTRPLLPDDSNHFPVRWKSTSDATSTSQHLGAGFSYLLAFDDVRASRHFRETINLPGGNTAGLLGLALINTDSTRRYQCFLNEAIQSEEPAPPAVYDWLQILKKHSATGSLAFSDDLLKEWASLSESSQNPSIAAALIRQATLFRLQGFEIEPSILESLSTGLIPQRFPRFWLHPDQQAQGSNDTFYRAFFRSQPQLLQLAGYESKELIISAEIERLSKIRSVMPEATLNLGSYLKNQIEKLRARDRYEECLSLAVQLESLPRDAFSPGTRFRRLTRAESPWVVGRTAHASLLLDANQQEPLMHLSRGFTAQDRAEYFAWQVASAARNEADTNVWLAALRREPESNDLVEQAENFLHAIDQPDEKTPYQIPGLKPTAHLSSKDPISLSLADQGNDSLLKDWPRRPGQAFSLPDWQNESLSLSSWAGRPVVVIFFLGGGCLHCVEQLTAFGPWNAQFEEAGIDILAVSTDPVEILSDTLKNTDNPDEAFPIPIVSDHELNVFKQWGVYDEFDERALHATFVINPGGEIIWEEKGNAPYMHPDFLLYEAKRLLELEK
ncbi:MAG: peroxiredoxin family protein [Verrucomicrobiales bacterium]|nr:peroxiredoxin family protein [Verrucomicrobiales bacterium]